MKKDEKSCPKCAETIKLEALRCKHCGEEFSIDEVEVHKAQKGAVRERKEGARRARKIDDEICVSLCLDFEDLPGTEIRPHELEEIAEALGLKTSEVQQRALHHGMKFVDKPRALGSEDWSQETSATIDDELRNGASEGVVLIDQWRMIEERHNVEIGPDRIHQLGLAYVDASGAVVDEATLRKRRQRPHRDHRSSTWSTKVISFALLLLMAGLLARCMIGPSSGDNPSSQSPDYARCEAELKPKLQRCLQGPESTWEACGEAYLDELKSCTGH